MTALQAQLASCCCDNRLATESLRATVLQENCADRYEASNNTRDIITNATANTQAILDKLLFRIDAVMESGGKKYILMNLPTDKVSEAVKILPAMRSPTVMPLAAEGWCSLHSVVLESELWDKIERLKAIGAEGILVLHLDKVID